MSREIKFRAWNPEGNMLNTFPLGDNNTNINYIVEHKWPIMQFTGLLDKNGKEIYEGDIVKREDKIWDVRFSYDRWILGRDKFEIDDNNTADDPVFVGWSDKCEIIGNIYENPELIKL